MPRATCRALKIALPKNRVRSVMPSDNAMRLGAEEDATQRRTAKS